MSEKSSLSDSRSLPFNRLHTPAIVRHKLALRVHGHLFRLAFHVLRHFHFHGVGLGAVHGHFAFAAGRRFGAGELELGGVAAFLQLFLLAVALGLRGCFIARRHFFGDADADGHAACAAWGHVDALLRHHFFFG